MNGSLPDLPQADSPLVVLAAATHEERLAQWRTNGASWRGALSIEAYLRREDHLSKQNLTKDGGISFWVLVDTSTNPRRVLAGCESFRKRALIARNGKVEAAISHGVGSVFCPPEMRRRGYAARMLRDLGNRLRTWQTDDTPCLFSVLYSDIGKVFYSALGWEPFHSSHVQIPVRPTMASSEMEKLPTARPLLSSDLAELCILDESLIRQSMSNQPTGQKFLVAQIPDLHTIQWHHAREEFLGKELHGRIPKIKGAIVGDSGNRIWCYWTRTWYNTNPQETEGNILQILRIAAEKKALLNWEGINKSGSETDGLSSSLSRAIASLFAAAQLEALNWKMAVIESWQPTDTVLTAAKRVSPTSKLVQRDKESIPSLRWYGEAPESMDGVATAHVEWIANEKFGWC